MKLVTNGGYAKVAPFTAVRWEGEVPVVRVQNRWSKLIAIDDIPIGRIVSFAVAQYGEKARKRFAEDLVQVLSEMGHEPNWDVSLELEREDGQVEQVTQRMSEINRSLCREYGSE